MDSKELELAEPPSERRGPNAESSFEVTRSPAIRHLKQRSSVSAMSTSNDLMLPSIAHHPGRADQDLDPKLDREIGLKLKSRISL